MTAIDPPTPTGQLGAAVGAALVDVSPLLEAVEMEKVVAWQVNVIFYSLDLSQTY